MEQAANIRCLIAFLAYGLNFRVMVTKPVIPPILEDNKIKIKKTGGKGRENGNLVFAGWILVCWFSMCTFNVS